MHYDQYDRAREKRAALLSWSAQIERLTGGIHDRPALEPVAKGHDGFREGAVRREGASCDS